MPEPFDAIVPVLQPIQADPAGLKMHFVYQLGMTAKNKAAIELIQKQIKTMEARLSALEART
jgi:hypothetical protein